ncbi:glycosyltransferase family 4 protein [uncultured Algibacter sp.]|uniref:glycosyltransferase family 4 protein n=1 Tax=uncultured Algibacter sp. TaxID=298659 RepID=UPI00260C17D2|nr:glycosyltransferase family 4 protein [uncultured Algibacter sp.]
MKIDFIISTLRGGGAERVLSLLVNGLAKNNKFEISVITLFEGDDNYILDSSVKRVVLSGNKALPSHSFRSIVNLSKYYVNKKNRPDLIISFITLTNFISIIVAKIFSIKIIAQEHNSHLRFMKNRKTITHITRKYIYKRADLITVLTSFDIEYYSKFGAHVRVMPNPCSFVPIKNNSHERKKTILAVGNLNRYHHKGLDNLIELIAPILKQNPDWTLKIAGAGDDGLKLLSGLAKKYNVVNQIIFTGFITTISKLMQESSIFILSSRFEGLPMVLLEAMSQGMTCIAYDCKTGPSDIITNNVNGLLIEDQNKKVMGDKLLELMNNKALRQSLANNGLKSLDRFDVDTIVNDYQEIFKRILNK